MVLGRMRDIARGRSVYTADRQRLGTVQDVQLETFKVEPPIQPGYWLPTRCVVAMDDDGLQLNFVKDALDWFKLEDPAGG